VRIIEKEIRRMFNLELHQMLEENKVIVNRKYNIEVIHKFMCSFCIDSISEDALLKNYYRWRENQSKRAKRREYKKKLKND